MYIFQKIIPQIYEPGFQMELKTQITFMQARELRIATKRFKMSFLEVNELFVTQLSQLGIWVKTFYKCGLALRLLFKNTIMFFLFRSAYVPKEFLDKVGSLLVPVI